MIKLTMVVPIYNDLESLLKLLELIEMEANAAILYLIVNNGSEKEEIDKCLSSNSNYWTSIKLDQNAGFGGGILEGVKFAKTEWIGWMPGNLKIQPKDVSVIVSNVQLTGNNFIKCRRLRKSKTAQFKTLLAGIIQTLITREKLFDTGGTPTICKREFVIGIQNLPTDYIFESRMLYEANRMQLKILRPTIPYGERIYGQSHWQRGLKSEARLMNAIIKDSMQTRKGVRK